MRRGAWLMGDMSEVDVEAVRLGACFAGGIHGPESVVGTFATSVHLNRHKRLENRLCPRCKDPKAYLEGTKKSCELCREKSRLWARRNKKEKLKSRQ